MSQETIVPVESSVPFSEYVKTENARESREAKGEPDPTEGVISDEKLHDLTPAKADTARAADGKFQAKDKAAAEPVVPAEPEKPKVDGDPRKSIQAKINLERRLRADAERERDELRNQLASRAPATSPTATTPQPPAQPTAKELPYRDMVRRYESHPEFPKYDDYSDAGFADPLAAYMAAQAAFIQDRRMSERQQEYQQQQVVREKAERAEKIHELGAAKYQDWDDILQSEAAHVGLPTPVLEAIGADIDSSADVIRHLVTHPEDLEVAMGLYDPIAAARFVGKLSAGVSTATPGPETPLQTTKAKPLIKPVNASQAASAPANPEDMEFGPNYIRTMNAKEKRDKAAMRGA